MKIPLREGGNWRHPGPIVAWAEVDAEDYEEIARYRWHLDPNGYAIRTYQPPTPTVCPECGWTPPPLTHVAHSVSSHRGKMHVVTHEKRYPIQMHRVIAGLERGDPRQVDHVNRNRIYNCRENLRIIPANIQAQNRTKPATHKGKPTESKYRGVYKVKKKGVWTGKWKASVDQHYLGCFATEEAAAEAARQYRLLTMPGAMD